MKAIRDNGYVPVKLPNGRWIGLEYLREEKRWYGALLDHVDNQRRCWWSDHGTDKTRKEAVQRLKLACSTEPAPC